MAPHFSNFSGIGRSVPFSFQSSYAFLTKCGTALTYRLASKLPTSWVDAYFTAQDYIASFLPAPKLLSSSSIRQHASRRTILRKPLPVVPVPGRHTATPTSMPHSLRSAYTTSEERSSESEGALSDPEHTGSQPITSSVASLASLPSEGESSRASESPVLGQSEYVQL